MKHPDSANTYPVDDSGRSTASRGLLNLFSSFILHPSPFLLLFLLLPSSFVFSSAAAIPEPPSLVYGRVVVRGGGHEMLLTEGRLSWQIRAVGESAPGLELETNMRPYGGIYSYAMRIPHEAQVFGEEVGGDAIALKSTSITHELMNIALDGVALEPAEPADAFLPFGQGVRAGAYRVDLVVAGDMPDTDEDGMPDWWEERVGLDKQTHDAAEDLDGDGIANGLEFAAGTDPSRDNTRPAILTTSVEAYSHAETVLALVASDQDSSPAQLVYTVETVPAGGFVSRAGTALDIGDTFTQADVMRGWIVYTSIDPLVDAASFDLTLRDENPDHGEHRSSVLVDMYAPSALNASWPAEWLTSAPASVRDILLATRTDPDRRRVLNALAGRWLGYRVWDCSRTSQPVECAAEVSSVLVGTPSDDSLLGSPDLDILCAGPGSDTLTGGGGADVFLVADDAGSCTIADFSYADGDRIDLSALLNGASTDLTDYVITGAADGSATLSIDRDGDGGGFVDLKITLAGLAGEFDAVRAYTDGRIIAAGLDQPVLVTALVAPGDGQAGETGPTSGAITLTRTGSLANALDVRLQISGSAENGTDYVLIPDTATFPAGAATVLIPVSPAVDYTLETEEFVRVSILPGDAYRIGTPSSGQVTIADLEERIAISVVESQALVASGRPATFLVSRSGMTARPTAVWIDISGTATAGVDYAAIADRIEFGPQQTAAYIDIGPLADADLAGGYENVVVAIRPDPARVYKVGDPGQASVTIYADETLLTDLNQDGIADAEDPDLDGIKTLEEIARGTDPERPTLVLTPGWSIVSIPVGPAPGQTVFDQLGGDFPGVIWEYRGGAYSNLSETHAMLPGRGYVVWCAAAWTVDLPPGSRPETPIRYEAGWSLVGPVNGGRLGRDRGGFSHIMAVDGGNYQVVDDGKLLPMKGYWAYRKTAGEVEMP